MPEFDLVVLGGGTGNVVASAAVAEGLDVALVERDKLGGTCLNRGCNPSKRLIHHADVVETVRGAESFGVDVTLEDIAFADIVRDVTETVTAEAEQKAEQAREHDRLTFYQTEGRFVDGHTVEVDVADGSERLTSDRIVLAGGSRPRIPDGIDGTDDVDFLTSDEAIRLDERPDRLVVVGGGYVAVELAHFFGQMGAEVAIVGHGDLLVHREDRDAAERLTDAYRRRYDLNLGYSASELAEDGDDVVVTAESEDGEDLTVRGDDVLLATGRKPNSDIWDVGAAGLETDGKGFVETDDYLETSVDGVWAIGDVAGNHMFKHSGDKEAEYVVENAVRGNREPVEYPGMAHAIFGSPQLASLGKPESEIDDGAAYTVGTREYDDTPLGSAMQADGFAKVLVGEDSGVLGVHVVGPDAATLIHEVSTAVAAGADAERIAETIHVHPALSEVVQGAFRDACGVAPTGI